MSFVHPYLFHSLTLLFLSLSRSLSHTHTQVDCFLSISLSTYHFFDSFIDVFQFTYAYVNCLCALIIWNLTQYVFHYPDDKCIQVLAPDDFEGVNNGAYYINEHIGHLRKEWFAKLAPVIDPYAPYAPFPAPDPIPAPARPAVVRPPFHAPHPHPLVLVEKRHRLE